MFEPNSRYYNLETASYVTSEGQTIAYKRRRFLPQGESLTLLVETQVKESDRLDLIAQRTLGDSEQFWRVADANNAMNPFELVEKTGSILRAPIPQNEEAR
jgi:hypothetical protein